MSHKLTDQQYVQRQGLIGPFCRRDDLDATSAVTLETDIGTRETKCNTCGKV